MEIKGNGLVGLVVVSHSNKLAEEVKVEIADAPLVEGIISAVAANFDEMSLSELKEIAEGSRNFKKIKK